MSPFKLALQNMAGQFARELVGAAFDALSEKFNERATKPQFAGDAEQVPSELPPGARLARERCCFCDGPLFFRVDRHCEGREVQYWCPRPKCEGGVFAYASLQYAAQREGIPL